MASLQSRLSKLILKPSMAWLFLFLPALSYYTSTRLHRLGLFRASSYGEMVETSLVDVKDCSQLQELVYTNKDCTSLHYPLYKVQENLQQIVATTWKHDEELGRGYLLLSSSYQHGKIWQWETGGGPIPIGRTLSMADSGCRSNLYQICSAASSRTGSGGIVVDALHEPPRLIVAEWGEGRITRLEENGARTPLILQVPYNTTTDAAFESATTTITNRLQQPFQLLLTPFGDLLVLDSTAFDGDYLWQLPQVHKIPGLKSLAESRKAHSWTQLDSNLPEKLLQSTQLGGMAFTPNSWLHVFVTMRQGDSVVVVTLSIDDEDDEDDDVAVQEVESKPKADWRQSAIYLDYTKYASQPGPMEVDEKGNLYLAVDDGILVVSSSRSILGKISLPNLSIVDITLGEDRFLYVSTETALYRTRLRNKLLQMPTDLTLKM
eukprot:scaffold1525_cov142-Cylindrotheca_fusiformis.AAC.7